MLYRGQKKNSYGLTLFSHYAFLANVLLQFCFRHSDAVGHVINLATDRRFGLVEVSERGLEGNRTVGRR
jgi:hypothetical protein